MLQKLGAQQRFTPSRDSSLFFKHMNHLPQNFYSQHLGFFCKQELRIQKATKLPLYFRLGSKSYVDYLEKKPNVVKGF